LVLRIHLFGLRNNGFVPVPRLRKIGLLMDRLVGFNHDVLLGIREFATPQRAWMCHFSDPRPEHLPVLFDWNPHGLLVFLFDAETRSLIEAQKAPFVDVANWIAGRGLPRVAVDDEAVGRMAADHLMDLGLERFAFVGRAQFLFSELRQKGFENRLGQFGFESYRYALDSESAPITKPWTTSGVNTELSNWVQVLPKPIGVFADNDERALMVSEACFASNIDVPGQVAILGVDNDPYLGSLGYPPLSSIATPARRVGYEAAALLEKIINGGKPPSQPIVLPPIRVVSRRSTDMLAIADPYVADAVRLIRERACDGLTIPELVAQTPVGRRTLEKLFQTYLGRSPLEEIRRVRLSHAQQLLATTDMPIDSVAQRSGFGSASWLATTFSQVLGSSPREYRKQIQGDVPLPR
jgi:LacI family transcriptional regulator